MSTSGRNRRLIWNYGIAAAGVAVAGLSPWWWTPIAGNTPPMRLMLVMVVTVSAWLGGVGPGLLATAMGIVAIIVGNDRPGDMQELANRLMRFGSLALLIDALIGGLHAQRRRADQRERELDRAERALREKESLLRSVYESSATAMGVIELTGDDARIISANAPTGRLFGREPGAVEGRTARELGLPPDRLSAWLEHLAGAGPPAGRSGSRSRAPGRRPRTGSPPRSRPWTAPRRRRPLLVRHRRHRRAQRTEDDLRVAKEQAEAASQAKDRFLAVLSHELRTPLTPVLIAVSSMIEEGPDPSLLPVLEMIRRNIELESRLIDDLLDLSRIARGRLRLDPEVVDMHRALRRAVEICRDETFVAGLEVVTELEARAYHVRADHARIMQIAWNLVRNAAKFTPTGGRLTIRTSNVPGEEAGAGGARLVVEFADTGIGIAPEVLPRIFEAFEQGRDELRGRSQGLGLGLALCRSLSEAMGGRLTASSPGLGRGSSFRLELGTVPAPAPATAGSRPGAGIGRDRPAARRSRRPSRTTRFRILLVEDNRDTLRYLATVLRGRGHDVVTAETIGAAREAVRRAERPFNLLLSDIELPDGTGLQLMRELGGRAGLRGIAMSGFGTEEDLQVQPRRRVPRAPHQAHRPAPARRRPPPRRRIRGQ